MPGDAITDWRSWTNQQEIQSGTPFPGQLAITDAEIISNVSEFPALVVTAATTANPAVLTVAGHGYVTGEIVTIAGALVSTELNGQWAVTVLTANTFSIPVNNTHTYTASSATAQNTGLVPLTAMGLVSIPTYPYTPTGAPGVDPFGGWTNQDEVGPSLTISGITAANPGVVTTSVVHGYVTGQVVAISGVTGKTEANGSWTITVLSTTTFSIPVDCTSGTFGGTAIVRLDTGRPAIVGLTA